MRKIIGELNSNIYERKNRRRKKKKRMKESFVIYVQSWAENADFPRI